MFLALLTSTVMSSKGKIIFKAEPNGQNKVTDRATAYLVHSWLKDSLSKGTGKGAFAQYGLRDKNAAGKTGTAYNFTDYFATIT